MERKGVRWFELHPWNEIGPDGKAATYSVDRAHTAVLRKLATEGATVYLQESRPVEFPEAKPYPYAAVYEYFKHCLGGKRRYFTNTISFQIALAVMEMEARPDDTHWIGIYGVDMMTGAGGGVNNEYGWQRPSCEYWIGRAEARGIEGVIPTESDLMSSAFVYGDYAGNQYRTKLEYEMRNTASQIQQFRAQINGLQATLAQFEGKKGFLEGQLNTWMPGDNGLGDGRAPQTGANKIAIAKLSDGNVMIAPPETFQPPVNRLALVPSDGPRP